MFNNKTQSNLAFLIAAILILVAILLAFREPLIRAIVDSTPTATPTTLVSATPADTPDTPTETSSPIATTTTAPASSTIVTGITLTPPSLIAPTPTIEDAMKVAARFSEQGYFVACTRADSLPFVDWKEGDSSSGELVGLDIDILESFSRRWLNVDGVVFSIIDLTDDLENIPFEDKARWQEAYQKVDEEIRNELIESVQPILVVVPSKHRITCIQNDWADFLIAGLGYTADRAQAIDYVDGVYAYDDYTILRHVNADGINNICDLVGKRIATVKGTSPEKYFQGGGFKQEITNICPLQEEPLATLKPFESRAEAVEAVLSGEADAYVTVFQILKRLAEENGEDLHVVPDSLFGGRHRFQIAVNKDGSEIGLKLLIEQTLSQMMNDGTMEVLHREHLEVPCNDRLSFVTGTVVEPSLYEDPYLDSFLEEKGGKCEEDTNTEIPDMQVEAGKTPGHYAIEAYGALADGYLQDLTVFECISIKGEATTLRDVIENGDPIIVGQILTFLPQEACAKIVLQ